MRRGPSYGYFNLNGGAGLEDGLVGHRTRCCGRDLGGDQPAALHHLHLSTHISPIFLEDLENRGVGAL